MHDLRRWTALVVLASAWGCGEDDERGASGGSTAAGTTDASTTTGETPAESSGASTGRADTTSDPAGSGSTSAEDTTGGAPSIPWEEGSIRVLPAIEADLVDFVTSLPHPNDGEYGVLSDERRVAVEAMLDALGDALQITLADPQAADWCGVLDLAAAAGYELNRLRDTATGRWFVYGADATTDGQTYVFVNPEARRDLVIEVPHEPFDSETAQQGARLLSSLSARALVLAKEHRCSDPDASECSGTTVACGGQYRESDVAHDARNVFSVVHALYAAGPGTRFVQLHGFDAPDGDLAEIGDGTNNDIDEGSIANVFAAHLGELVGDPSAVFSCQAERGDPPEGLCGASNVQAHATHDPDAAVCPSTSDATNRFLHVEQSATLRDDDETDGASWADVRDALALTWPDCTLAPAMGPRDCGLGPPQGSPEPCACGRPCR